MQLGEFTYIFLVFCIPFLGYIVNSTNPKKGFSILFISIISGTVFLIPSNFSFFGLFFLLFYLSNFYVKAKNFLLLLSLITYSFEIYQLVTNKIFLFSLPIIMVASVFSLMMIGHWFLVDPTISRVGMKNIAKFSSIISILLSLLVFLGFFESSSSIFNIISSQELSYVVIGLYLSASLLSFGSYKSLQEKSYTGVMASTGLSYLSLIVSMGATGTLILSL
jgi:hypothetical protein